MKNIAVIVSTIFVALSLSFCSRSNKDSTGNKNNISIDFPGKADLRILNESMSVNIEKEPIKIPVEVEEILPTEECDGEDNNDNKLFDEQCYTCCNNSVDGDFDCDGKVTKYDCNAPLLIAYNATIFKGEANCVDLNNDGVVNMSDTIACLNIVKGGKIK